MYIDTSYSRKKYRRHLLRDSYRENGKVKHHTWANLSHCSDEEISAIKLALKNKGNLAQLINIEAVKSKQGMRVGAVLSLKAIADRIGLTRVLGNDQQGRLALWQVIARLIGQGSRLKAVRLAQSHAACDILGLEAFNEDHLYGNLAWLAQKQESVEKRLFRQRYGSEPPQLFLYDVTSSYLEGVQNVLAAFGYNRDKIKGKMQLVIGLLTGPEGAAVAVRVFDGNTPDTKTVATQVGILADNFGVKDVTLVGDRGMLKQAETELLTEERFHYITAITKPQIDKLVKGGQFQMGMFEEKLCEVKWEGIRYILRRNPERVTELASTRESKLAKVEALLKTKNRYLARHPRAKVEVAQRDIQEKVTKLKIDGWVKPESKGRFLELTVDGKAREEKARLDGCYVIKTDLSTEMASAELVHDRYKDLAQVERAFRTFKDGHLQVQPTFVWTEASTRGHVFVVMLAYLLERELDNYWRDLEVTVAEGIDELGSLRGVEFTIGQAACQKIPEPEGLNKQLLDAAKIKLPEVLPLRKINVATRKKLVSQRH